MPEFVHEEAHRKFCEDHDGLGLDLEKTKALIDKCHIEIERHAVLEEINFIKQAIDIVPEEVNTNEFNVKSWLKKGLPFCDKKKIVNCPKVGLWFLLTECEQTLRCINSLETKSYQSAYRPNKPNYYVKLSKALKLPQISTVYPIVEL